MFSRALNEYIEQAVLKETFADGVLITNGEGIIQYVKIYKDNVFLFDTKQAVGKHITELYPDVNPEESTVLNAIKGIPTLGKETIQTSFQGETCILHEHTLPVRMKNDIIGAVSFAKFVTYSKGEIFLNEEGETEKSMLYCVDDIIGHAPVINNLKNKIEAVARTNSSVMITGETGTGKELVAQAIHTSRNHGGRGAFVSQNCSAIPDTLLESLLFGTTKGSFTGAENRKGLFEIANGGTIFLDEINSMNVSVQAKILKVIEEKRVARLGSHETRDMDVRIISAINEDPFRCMDQGRLRKDLYYRLSPVQIEVPSLKERSSDIFVLSTYYINKYNGKMGKKIKGLSRETENLFLKYEWPGNIRELRNAIEGAFNFKGEGYIELDDVPEHIKKATGVEKAAVSTKKEMGAQGPFKEKICLSREVDAYEKNILQSQIPKAESLKELTDNLGISRQSLYYKLKKYSLELPYKS